MNPGFYILIPLGLIFLFIVFKKIYKIFCFVCFLVLLLIAVTLFSLGQELNPNDLIPEINMTDIF